MLTVVGGGHLFECRRLFKETRLQQESCNFHVNNLQRRYHDVNTSKLTIKLHMCQVAISGFKNW